MHVGNRAVAGLAVGLIDADQRVGVSIVSVQRIVGRAAEVEIAVVSRAGGRLDLRVPFPEQSRFDAVAADHLGQIVLEDVVVVEVLVWRELTARSLLASSREVAGVGGLTAAEERAGKVILIEQSRG